MVMSARATGVDSGGLAGRRTALVRKHVRPVQRRRVTMPSAAGISQVHEVASKGFSLQVGHPVALHA